jgi:hypothetical protein
VQRLDPAALTAALAAAPHLASQQQELYAALARIRDQHGYLDTAWTALGRTDSFTHLATITDPPAEVAALATLVRDATIAWASYQASGEFVPWHRPRLSTGALQQPQLVAFVNGLIANVTTDRGQYEASRLATVNDLIAQSHAQGTIQSVTDRMKALADQDADLVGRLLALDDRDSAERAALAQFQQAFEAFAASNVLDANATYQVQTLATIRPSAADAHYSGVGAPDLAGSAFSTVAMHSGEALRMHVTGRWSPTCAVSHAQLQGPNGTLEPVTVSDAETGPEGFWLGRETDGYHSHSTTDTEGWRRALGGSLKACGGGALPAGIGSVEFCVHADFESSWSGTTSDANGTNTRTAASFGTGLRLPNTPFPIAPAGSLVAVITPANRLDQILDVRVVHPDDLIVAPTVATGDVEVRLYVNDLGTCTPPATPALQIDAVKTIPVGNVAKALGAAVASTLTALEAQAPRILAQGVLSGEEISALRVDAWTRVQNNLVAFGIGLAGMPADLRQLFDSFLEREIASLARRGQMHGLARERIQLELAAEALAHELTFASDQNRLQLLIPRWRLRDLSGVRLAQNIDALSEALTADVALVFELRDPGAFGQFGTQATSQIDALIDVNITAPYEDTVSAFEGFASAASQAIAHATFELGGPSRKNVVVAIPRTAPSCPTQPCLYASWRAVSQRVANTFWAATAAAPFTASIDITPADLYGATGTGSLACGDVAPVVRRMAMYLDTADSSIDLASLFTFTRSAAAMAGSTVTFPLVEKVIRIEADSPAGVGLDVPVLNGDAAAVSTKFGPSPADLGVGAGLSPFTTFRFDMTPFQTGVPAAALAAANAVFLVFEVEQRVSTSNVFVPGVCQAAL